MNHKRALEPTMSMSLFKSPEYAQEVWSWLDKHGDTPVSRENFKHLVSICTLRPTKAASRQPLQRRSSGTQEAADSRSVPSRFQTLVQQGSTRFIPAALVSSKPAPPPRPASAAAPRRKYATSTRPSTAAPSTVMSQASLKGSTPSISPPPVTASAMLQAGGPPLTRPLPPTRALSQTHQPTPPFAAPLPGKRKKAAIHASSSAACSSSADSAPSDVAAAESATTADYDVESVRVSASKDALAACSSDAVPDANNSVKGQGRSSVLETETLHSSPAPASYRTDAALTDCDSSQQQLPKLSIPAERQAAEATALQTCSNVAKRNAAQASSRPSSTHSKQGASSSFDRRLALLHKGLPTYMPPSFAAATRPSSRSRRASTPGLPATPSHQPPAQLSMDPNCLPGSDWTAEESSSALDAAAGARNGTTNGLTSDATNGITHGTTNGITPLASEAALPHPGVHHATTLAAPTGEAAWVGNEGSMSKPSSPTSVLPNQGGLGDTTYHSSHGLADAYPELYRAAAAAGRAQKANSRALQCFVGDTLRGNPDLWRHQLKSAYTLCNDRLKHDAGWGDLEGASDGSFLEWVGRSQLYSGDVLAPQALEDLTGWMAQAAPGDRRSMMALLRELHATISPTGSSVKSVSHSTHTRQVPFSSGQVPFVPGQVPFAGGQAKEAEGQLHVGARPGTPLPALPKDQPASQAESISPVVQAAPHLTSATQVSGAGKPRGINVNAVPSKGTFRSSICLSEGAAPTAQSTYGQVHGASMPQLMQAVRTTAQQHAEAKKPVLVTCPYGSLDPLLDHAHLPLFPVPPALLQEAAQLHTDAQRSGFDATQYGQSFCSEAFRGDAAAILAAAQKEKQASKAAGSRTTIPLGKKAVNCIPVYDTTYHDEYKARNLDISQQMASAEHMRSLYHAPTATVGCVTRSH